MEDIISYETAVSLTKVKSLCKVFSHTKIVYYTFTLPFTGETGCLLLPREVLCKQLDKIENVYPAPIQAEVLKLLREREDIDITINRWSGNIKSYYYKVMKNNDHLNAIVQDYSEDKSYYDSLEDALRLAFLMVQDK